MVLAAFVALRVIKRRRRHPFYAISSLNIWHSDTGADGFNNKMVQRITAPFYGSDARGQDEIAVVYVQDADIQALRESGISDWPPNFADYGKMLKILARYEPSAIFFDYLFTGDLLQPDEASRQDCQLVITSDNAKVPPAINPKASQRQCLHWRLIEQLERTTRYGDWKGRAACETDPLARMACIRAAGGTPVLLGKVPPAMLCRWSDFQAALAQSAIFVTVNVGPQAYPLHQAYGPETCARSAQMLKDMGIKSYDLSPAALLFADWCQRSDAACGIEAFKANHDADLTQVSPVDWASTGLQDPMGVQWGVRPARDQGRIDKYIKDQPGCETRSSSMDSSVRPQAGIVMGLRTLHEFLPILKPAGAECLYTLNMPYTLVAGRSDNAAIDADLTKTLRGRIIMLGAAYATNNDWIDSPVHGRVPGVFVHAMALDNLIEKGKNYRLAESGLSDVYEAFIMFVLGVYGRFAFMSHRDCQARFEASRSAWPIVRFYLNILIICGVILMLAVILWLPFSRHPTNWLTIAALATSLGVIRMLHPFSKDMGDYMARENMAVGFRHWLRVCSQWFDPDVPAPETETPPKASTKAPSKTTGKITGKKPKGVQK